MIGISGSMGVCRPEMETWALAGRVMGIGGHMASMGTTEMICVRRLAMEASDLIFVHSQQPWKQLRCLCLFSNTDWTKLSWIAHAQQQWFDAVEMTCICSPTMDTLELVCA